MYLSRLILNPTNRRVQRELAHPYELHRSLMRAFPDDLKEGQERVLFRLDVAHNGHLTLLVQSWHLPDWAWVAESGARGYLLRPPETKPFDLQLAPGQVFTFRLRANPTIKRKFDNGDHKRVGVYREEEQVAWLRRKGEQGGFALLSAQARPDGAVGGKTRDQQSLNLLAVRFDGLLQVTDPAQLCEAVRQGIGSGKGLGFGLLSLARPPA